ncbi:CGNR zinc finger domain-containing protein [Polymorphospora rubra]|uniref:CGNR zinc finger domain-containing protein n=1 Tax=Polymorphospora rubra TaxID=338584 RepID=UPI0033C7AEB3
MTTILRSWGIGSHWRGTVRRRPPGAEGRRSEDDRNPHRERHRPGSRRPQRAPGRPRRRPPPVAARRPPLAPARRPGRRRVGRLVSGLQRPGPGTDPHRARPRDLGGRRGPSCRNLYLGTGPGSPRRYCSTTCASRTRVAEHRRRKQTRTSSHK